MLKNDLKILKDFEETNAYTVPEIVNDENKSIKVGDIFHAGVLSDTIIVKEKMMNLIVSNCDER